MRYFAAQLRDDEFDNINRHRASLRDRSACAIRMRGVRDAPGKSDRANARGGRLPDASR